MRIPVLKALHKIFFPVVYTLFVAETTYLVFFHIKERKLLYTEQGISVKPAVVHKKYEPNINNAEVTQISTAKISKKAQKDISSGKEKKLQPKQENGKEKNQGFALNKQEVERALDAMDEFIAADDEENALKVARILMNSEDADVRREVLDTLGWIGVKALPELTSMLGDDDAELAADAFEEWENAVDDISEDKSKAAMLAAGLKVMTDEDAIESAILTFDTIDDKIAVRAIAEIIESGTPASAAVAYEHYNFVTDEDYTTRQAVEDWIARQYEEDFGPTLEQ